MTNHPYREPAEKPRDIPEQINEYIYSICKDLDIPKYYIESKAEDGTWFATLKGTKPHNKDLLVGFGNSESEALEQLFKLIKNKTAGGLRACMGSPYITRTIPGVKMLEASLNCLYQDGKMLEASLNCLYQDGYDSCTTYYTPNGFVIVGKAKG